jgi:hypothetical protein
MTDGDKIAHLTAALVRVATPEAFYVATSNVDPEAFARMVFAQAILEDHTLESATAKAEFETRQRYPLNRTRKANL